MHLLLAAVVTGGAKTRGQDTKYQLRVPPPLQFRLENLVSNQSITKQAPCGAEKCFFQLASDQNVGYLVGFAPRPLSRMKNQWDNGQHLKEKYDMQHLMMAEPRLAHIESAELAAYMSNHNVRQMWPDQPKHQFQRGSSIANQRMRVLPEPNEIFGCQKGKQRHVERAWGDFMASVNQDIFVPNFTKALESLQTNMETWIQTGAIVNNYDFQAIAGNDGTIYLLDIALHPPLNTTAKGKNNSSRKKLLHKDMKRLKQCQGAFSKMLSKMANLSSLPTAQLT